MRTYYLAKAGKWMNSMPEEFVNYYSVLDWISFSVATTNKSIFEDTYRLTNPQNRFYTLNEMVGSKGFRSFAEVRDTIKLIRTDLGDGEILDNTAAGGVDTDPDNESGVTNSWNPTLFAFDPQTTVLTVTQPDQNPGEKVAIPFDQQRKDATVLAMKAVAKAVVEEEFDNRLSKLDLNNILEEVTFVYQWEEAKAWEADNTAEVPILTALATARGLTVEEIVAKINTARVSHKTKVTKLLQKMAEVKQAYKNCTTIREMNRFYEDYFNIEMPQTQAVDEGRLVIDAETGVETRTQILGIGLAF
jgi:hypothetical protein